MVDSGNGETMTFVDSHPDLGASKNKYSEQKKKPECVDVLERALCDEIPADDSLAFAFAFAYAPTHKSKFQTWTKYHSYLTKRLKRSVQEQVNDLKENQVNLDKEKAKFLKLEADLENKFQKEFETLRDGVNVVPKGLYLSALKKILAEEITDRDEGPLNHLNDIKWRRIDTSSMGFELTFYFEGNTYFKNKFLSKTFDITDDGSGVSVFGVHGTDIEWTGKSPCDYPGCKSFFNFFKPLPCQPEELQNREYLKKQVTHDYHVGCAIRDQFGMIITHFLKLRHPRPVRHDHHTLFEVVPSATSSA